jgi:hypothetical protein
MTNTKHGTIDSDLTLAFFSIINSHYLKYNFRVKASFHLGFVLRIFSLIGETGVLIVMGFLLYSNFTVSCIYKTFFLMLTTIVVRFFNHSLFYFVDKFVFKNSNE